MVDGREEDSRFQNTTKEVIGQESSVVVSVAVFVSDSSSFSFIFFVGEFSFGHAKRAVEETCLSRSRPNISLEVFVSIASTSSSTKKPAKERRNKSPA